MSWLQVWCYRLTSKLLVYCHSDNIRSCLFETNLIPHIVKLPQACFNVFDAERKDVLVEDFNIDRVHWISLHKQWLHICYMKKKKLVTSQWKADYRYLLQNPRWWHQSLQQTWTHIMWNCGSKLQRAGRPMERICFVWFCWTAATSEISSSIFFAISVILDQLVHQTSSGEGLFSFYLLYFAIKPILCAFLRYDSILLLHRCWLWIIVSNITLRILKCSQLHTHSHAHIQIHTWGFLWRKQLLRVLSV